MKNKLQTENSPYLLQHATNPVNWYPWGEEAFAQAEKLDLPIFLSIGYATCHWCHVMEHESFEDKEVALFLNENFVSIKVDREQRPDIDSIYMAVCQMMTQRGGWPLSIFMTPSKEPFFAGTYFPKSSKNGMVGFLDLLPKIKEVWETKREDVLKSAETIVSSLKDVANPSIPNSFIAEKDMNEIFESLKDFYDEKYGGFGEAPKFPSPQNLVFLSNFFNNTNNKDSLRMIDQTLTSMLLGGIYDHIGFGFHRYSTDVKWLVPHFEKMLYDQATILEALYESYLVTKKNLFLQAGFEIKEYLKFNLQSPEGGFYSAEDADSEGEEGLFYIWSYKELEDALTSDEFQFFKHLYNVEEEGNFLEETTKNYNGKNIIYLKNELKEFANTFSLDEKSIFSESSRIKGKLKSLRDERNRPLLDDKILLDWNAMTISSLSKMYRATLDNDFIELAIKANSFIEANMAQSDNLFFHCYRGGKVSIDGFLDDYSFYTKSLIDLYESTLNPEYLNKAITCCNSMIDIFWDDENGLFFLAKEDSKDLIVRQKNLLDGAIPSGNSTALFSLLKLSMYQGDNSLFKKAELLSSKLGEMAKKFPINLGQFLANQYLFYGDEVKIVVTSELDSLDSNQELFKYLINLKVNKKTIFHINSEKVREEFIKISDKYSFLPNSSKEIKIYVCSGFTCKNPVSTLDELKEILG